MDPVKAKANFSRLCQLLIDKGGDALRGALHAVHPPPTLAVALNANKRILQKIRYSVINATQWDLLFPGSGSPDSNNFDITLLTILLRNICGLTSPATGWNVMPPASDTSISADILRIKLFRNEVYGHIPTAQYDDTTFETLWHAISKPLVNLGISQQHIDALKEVPLSPAEEIYIERLKEWKELEDNFMAKIKDVDEKVENLTDEVVKLRRALANTTTSKVDQMAKFDFTGKIDGLCKKFQVDTREWFFSRLTNWFTDEESRVMILTAGPGIGKSVLAAKVCELYKQRHELAACHFCSISSPDSRNPFKIIQSLASQMSDNVDGFRDKLTEVLRREHSEDSLSGAFRVFLNDPLHALDKRMPMLIVLDALDESKTEEKSELLELISENFRELPNWVKILILSRPELQVKEKLQHLDPLEIRPEDRDHNNDVEYFIRCCLPNLDKGNVSLLMSECEGSFLCAYYLVKELRGKDMGIEPNLIELIPSGISGFYKKQFERLRTGLQHFNIGIIESGFINVVAASRAPLPIKILLNCMGVSDKKYEIRDSIINIMSEILPIYDDCLTVYHKSLLDWLTLKGYKEHAFVADAADGNKRLWQACKGVYSDTDFLIKSASELQTTTRLKYAFEHGAQHLVNACDTEDFHWLVNVDLNFRKLEIFEDLKVDLFFVLTKFKTELSDDLYWTIVQTHAIMGKIKSPDDIMYSTHSTQRKSPHHLYLQSLANGIFNFRKNTLDQNRARNVLRERNMIWVEEITNGCSSNSTIISNAFIKTNILSFLSSLSPDKRLLALLREDTIKVFMLPSLTIIFDLKINSESKFHRFLVFSPDSSYLLWNSARSCLMIKEQKEIPFILNSPEFIISCSFSSCGEKLITTQHDCIEVWDVRTKNRLQLIPVDEFFFLRYAVHSKCDGYICGLSLSQSELAVWNSATLKQLDSKRICIDKCLTNLDDIQFISDTLHAFGSYSIIKTGHFHLPNGKIVLPRQNGCSEPFTWKDRTCLGFTTLSSSRFTLVVYDFINEVVVDLFEIDGLPRDTSIKDISSVDEKNFLMSLNSGQLFVWSFESAETSVTPILINSVIKCASLSSDNLYVACCYNNRTLAIRSADHPDMLRIIQLQHHPEACWWSERYLWVICKGAVVKFSYDSTYKNVLGNCLEECDLDFDKVLKFSESVLVLRTGENISILKVCDERLCPQEIPDPTFAVSSLAISSDGCAVLLYGKSVSVYLLWEKAQGNRWEFFLSGNIKDHFAVKWICLTGSRNSRHSQWFVDLSEEPMAFNEYCLLSIDMSKKEENLNYLSIYSPANVVCSAHDIIIIENRLWIHFLKMSCCRIIATLYFDLTSARLNEESVFYFPSRGVLILVVDNDIQYVKIHNIENYLN